MTIIDAGKSISLSTRAIGRAKFLDTDERGIDICRASNDRRGAENSVAGSERVVLHFKAG